MTFAGKQPNLVRRQFPNAECIGIDDCAILPVFHAQDELRGYDVRGQHAVGHRGVQLDVLRQELVDAEEHDYVRAFAESHHWDPFFHPLFHVVPGVRWHEVGHIALRLVKASR